MVRDTKNPYTLVFGKEPKQLISRNSNINEIIDVFEEKDPVQQIFMITGVRGSGKTVFMTNLSKKMRAKKDWIVVELNPELDLLEGLAAKLAGKELDTGPKRKGEEHRSLETPSGCRGTARDHLALGTRSQRARGKRAVRPACHFRG